MSGNAAQRWGGRAVAPASGLAASIATSRQPNQSAVVVTGPRPPVIPAAVTPSVQPTGTIAGTAYTLHGKGAVGTSPSSYSRGQIIRTLYFTPNMDPNIQAMAPSIGFTQDAGPVSGKLRPFVILAVTDTHLKCIPMFTSGSQGFGSKPPTYRWECLYLRHWSDEGEEWDGYTPRDYLMTLPRYMPKPGSYVMWTRTYDVDYGWPISKLGGLSRDSFNRLRQMHEIGYKMGNNNLTNQRTVADQALADIVVTDEFTAMKNQQLAVQKPNTDITRPAAPVGSGKSRSMSGGGGGGWRWNPPPRQTR